LTAASRRVTLAYPAAAHEPVAACRPLYDSLEGACNTPVCRRVLSASGRQPAAVVGRRAR
jgi:hypothetical protein